MKKSLQSLILFFCFLLAGVTAHSQEELLKNIVTVGISTPLLDNGIGFHAGYNPVLTRTGYFSMEGYAGYNYTRVIGAFLSGENSSIHTSEWYVGPRLYFANKTRKFRLFINLLTGIQYRIEIDQQSSVSQTIAFGLAPGLHVLYNRFQGGIYYSKPDQFGIRLGYIL